MTDSNQKPREPEDLIEALRDVDLMDLDWMPLDTVRLRQSTFAMTATGEEFMAAMLLWTAAWHQVPAASLPNDDRQLAQLSGYGRAVNDWLKVREMALYGFLEGPDGRLYHPVIMEKVFEALQYKSATETKRAQSRRSSRAYREKLRQDKQQGSDVETPKRREPTGSSDNGAGERHGDNEVTVGDCHGDVTERHGDAPTLPNTTRPSPPLSPPGGGEKKQTRPCRLPPDWDPGDEGRGFAVGLGLDAEKTLRRFRDHCAGLAGMRGKSSEWPARWREWCDGAADRLARPGKSRSTAPQPNEIGGGQASQWDARAAGWANGKTFWPSSWGPPPDQAGCQCPPHVLKAHGIKPQPRH